MGWFDHALNAVGGEAERLATGAEHATGTIIEQGARLAGAGLGAVGLTGAAQAVVGAGDTAADFLGAEVPEEQLGQTTDPTQLIHGDPAAISQTAQQLRAFSGAFGETAAGLSGIDTAHWTGQAADAFRARYAPQPARWQDAATGCRDGAAALDSYAETVTWAQGQARQAIDLYEAGERATAAAVTAYDEQVAGYNQAAQAYNDSLAAGHNPGPQPTRPGPFTDPGQALREQAERVLALARQRRDESAGEAAAKVRAATSLAPAEPSFTQRLVDDLADASQAGQLAELHFGGGIVEGTADLVKFARSLNPTDPYNMTHLAEYGAGLSATAAGLAHEVTHPADLVQSLVGSGWSSDPFQAAGKLVPNVVLAVGTAGAGTAADAGADVAERAVMGSGEDAAAAGLRDAAANPEAAARAPADMTMQADPVDVASGDVVLAQIDVTLPGALPLAVRRVHRSSWRAGRWFGPSWASTFDQRLAVNARGVLAAFADGRILCFPPPGEDGAQAWPVSGPGWPLARDADGSYTVTDPQAGTVWRFAPRSGYYVSAAGHGELPLVSVTDRAGHQITFSYDQAGAPETIIHDGGYRIRVSVADGLVTGLALAGAGTDGAGAGSDGAGAGPHSAGAGPHDAGTGPHGRDGRDGRDRPLTRYAYDSRGQLAEIINSSGQPLRLSYDEAGRLDGWEDRNGRSYRYRYDDQGRCVSAGGPGGVLSGTLSYDLANRVTTWTDQAGAATVYQLSDRCQVAAVIDPLGNVTRWDHDERGRVIAHADPLGRITRYRYDGAGNLAAVTYPDGTQATAQYNELNLPVAVTGPDGAIWRQDYDPTGNPVQLTGPDGAVTRFSYDGRGHLAGIVDPLGAATRVECDPAGLPVSVTGPDGAPTRYARDKFGRITAVTGPGGEITRLSWTTEGRLDSRTLPDGSVERWAYDGEGNLARHVSPAAGLTEFEYTSFDLVSAQTGPDGARTEFGYDHALRLTAVTHGGLTWRYEYDPAGRLVAETDYNGATTRYAYDAAGQVAVRVSDVGQHTGYRYDQLGNLVERGADGAVTAFGYDAAGRLAHAHGDDAEIQIERDAAGRVTAETCNGRTVRSSYDACGRRIHRSTPSGAQTRWQYDPAGRPIALHADGQELRFGYDAAGRETRRDLPGGLTLSQDWNPAGRLAAQALTAAPPRPSQPVPTYRSPLGPSQPAAGGGRLLQRRAYSYRADGCLSSLDDLLAGPRLFTLDPAGKVKSVEGPGWAERYAYDAAGNLTAAAWPAPPPGPADFWLGADLQGRREYAGPLITQSGSVRYQHDRRGRITLRQRARISRKPDTWHYEWDADDRLTAVTTPDRTRWRYRYDPLGRRIAKQRLAPDGHVAEQTDFTWDGATLAEQVTTGALADPRSTPAQHAAPLAARHAAPSPGGAAGPPGGAAGGDPGHVITWDYQPGTFTPVIQAERLAPRDAQQRDAPQRDIDLRFYAIVTDLIGTPTELTAPDGTLAGYQQHTLWGTTLWHPGGASTPLRFPGQYADPETGLHYNNQRYYDPATGRYLSPDSLGLAPSPNPHTYVPNPCTYIDPLGLMGCGPGAQDSLVNLASPARTSHILDGEVRPNGSFGGGHRFGTGFPGKSEFPASWSDAQIMHNISDVATDPNSVFMPGRGGDIWATGARSGIDIEMLMRNGEIWTGYPTNVLRNP
jgi:RHS repeat-associated protein